MAKHPIPDAALSQHVAIVAQTGAGKSYATRVIVEGLLDEHRRVCIVDYTGVWWGLRSSATGKSSGYPIVIFGGDHADVPLNEQAGPVVAAFVAHGDVPCIIDLDGMTVGAQQRFVTAFLEELYRLNNRPLHLIIEEIDEFAPQTAVKGTERMVGATARIFQRGRKKGFRAIAITQRPANVHKRVLAQCKTLIALRLVHPRDREAIEDWISGHAATGDASEFIDALAGLQTGEGFVWAPEQGVLERVKFSHIRTFDSMKAPEEGEDVQPARWADVDLDALRGRMGELVQEAEASDPKRLKADLAKAAAEIARLKRELEVAEARKPTADPEALAAAESRGFEQASKQLLDAANRDVQQAKVAFLQKLSEAVGPLMTIIKEELQAVHAAPDLAKALAFRPSVPPSARSTPAATSGRAVTTPRRSAHTIAGAGGNGTLPPGERAVLTAAAQYDGVDRDQLSVLTGYKRSSRDAYVQRLREKGYVELAGQTVLPTNTGIAALGSEYEPLPIGDALQTYWRARLPEGERRILEELITAYPDGVERPHLDSATGYKRSSRDAYIQRLKSRRLLTTQGSEVCASETLF